MLKLFNKKKSFDTASTNPAAPSSSNSTVRTASAISTAKPKQQPPDNEKVQLSAVAKESAPENSAPTPPERAEAKVAPRGLGCSAARRNSRSTSMTLRSHPPPFFGEEQRARGGTAKPEKETLNPSGDDVEAEAEGQAVAPYPPPAEGEKMATTGEGLNPTPTSSSGAPPEAVVSKRRWGRGSGNAGVLSRWRVNSATTSSTQAPETLIKTRRAMTGSDDRTSPTTGTEEKSDAATPPNARNKRSDLDSPLAPVQEDVKTTTAPAPTPVLAPAPAPDPVASQAGKELSLAPKGLPKIPSFARLARRTPSKNRGSAGDGEGVKGVTKPGLFPRRKSTQHENSAIILATTPPPTKNPAHSAIPSGSGVTASSPSTSDRDDPHSPPSSPVTTTSSSGPSSIRSPAEREPLSPLIEDTSPSQNRQQQQQLKVPDSRSPECKHTSTTTTISPPLLGKTTVVPRLPQVGRRGCSGGDSSANHRSSEQVVRPPLNLGSEACNFARLRRAKTGIVDQEYTGFAMTPQSARERPTPSELDHSSKSGTGGGGNSRSSSSSTTSGGTHSPPEWASHRSVACPGFGAKEAEVELRRALELRRISSQLPQ